MADPDEAIETLVAGLTREWRHEHRLVIYRLEVFTAPIIDAYVDSCFAMIRDGSPHRPEYGIHHFVSASLKIDSSLYTRLMKLADALKQREHRAVAAVILPDTWVFRSLLILGEIFMRRAGDATVCYFVNFDMAQRWIEGMMQRDNAAL